MAKRHPTDGRSLDGDALLERVVALCHERKAEDVVSLDVRGLVEYMDHLVIVSGRGPRQNRAIAEHVMTELKRGERVLPLSKAGLDAGTWICVDLVDVVLHVFEPDTRSHYDLELLWGDALRTEHEAPRSAAAEAEGAEAGADAEETQAGAEAEEAQATADDA